MVKDVSIIEICCTIMQRLQDETGKNTDDYLQRGRVVLIITMTS